MDFNVIETWRKKWEVTGGVVELRGSLRVGAPVHDPIEVVAGSHVGVGAQARLEVAVAGLGTVAVQHDHVVDR